MIEGWQKLYPQPFAGITNDGVRREGLFPLAPARPGEEAPTADMVAAARQAPGHLHDRNRRGSSRYAVDAPEWQSWANPEFMQHDTGLRLDELGRAGPGRDPWPWWRRACPGKGLSWCGT